MGKDSGKVARKIRRRIERRAGEGLAGLREELEDSEDRRGA